MTLGPETIGLYPSRCPRPSLLEGIGAPRAVGAAGCHCRETPGEARAMTERCRGSRDPVVEEVKPIGTRGGRFRVVVRAIDVASAEEAHPTRLGGPGPRGAGPREGERGLDRAVRAAGGRGAPLARLLVADLARMVLVLALVVAQDQRRGRLRPRLRPVRRGRVLQPGRTSTPAGPATACCSALSVWARRPGPCCLARFVHRP
jgi:hypothetical protein